MSTAYTSSSYSADIYESFRPTYPESFYSKLLEYHEHSGDKALDKLLDVGCGSATSTIPFSKHFKSTIGTDSSPSMIAKANSLVSEQGLNDLVSFKLCSAEEIHTVVEPDSVDIITAAECVHWFDSPKFIESSFKTLKSGGTLAFWIYVEPIFPDPKANEIYLDFAYKDPRYIGPCWDQKTPTWREFGKVTNELLWKDSRFENIDIVLFDQTHRYDGYTPPLTNKSNSFKIHYDYKKDHDKILDIHASLTLDEFINYFSTFSAILNWYNLNPGTKGTEKDILNLMRKAFTEKAGWSNDTKIDIAWDSMFCFATKR